MYGYIRLMTLSEDGLVSNMVVGRVLKPRQHAVLTIVSGTCFATSSKHAIVQEMAHLSCTVRGLNLPDLCTTA